jgi:glutamine synthetase
MRETLGDHILERFVEAKTSEWQDYATHVSGWETERYLPIY